jgi:hypothetical protein
MISFLVLLMLGSNTAPAAEPQVLAELAFQREAGPVRYQALADGTVLKRVGGRILRKAQVPQVIFEHDVKGMIFEGLEGLRKGPGVNASRCVESEARVVVPGGAPFRVCEDEVAVRELLRMRAEAFEIVMKRDYGKH